MSFAICIACFATFVVFYNERCTNLVIFWGYVVCFCKRRCKNFAQLLFLFVLEKFGNFVQKCLALGVVFQGTVALELVQSTALRTS